MSFLSSVNSLLPSLAETITNGLAIWGTLSQPLLPDFISTTPGARVLPWGGATVENTNPYVNPPSIISNIGRTYNFNVARGTISPDGVNRSAILVNGQFPGPLIEANWGETITVNVHNQITGPEEGTSIHWHGFLQNGTQYADGVPSVSQCPIAPGKSFTYTFKATLQGTSWYHSHYSAQYNAGVFGPIVVYGPKTRAYDVDLGPIMLTDWYHDDYFTLVKRLMTPGPAPPLVFSDNNLINGKMDFDCSKVTPGQACTPNAGLSKFKFQTGKTHRLRLINAGSEGTQQFSIDGHNMTIIAEDFVPVQPRTTNVVTLGIGQRTDVLVKATGKSTDAYWMRSNITCSLANQPFALAAVYYPNADTNAKPNSTVTPFAAQCGNDNLSLSQPRHNFGPVSTPATTQTIEIDFHQNLTNYWLFYVNGVSSRANYNYPILDLASKGNTSYPDNPEWNAYDFGSNSSIRFILHNHNAINHPMHMHGHNFQVLAVGTGTWDGTVTHADNPMRRDVFIMPGGTAAVPGYLVLQIDADNPGVWPLHCHIAFHLSAGLSMNVIERPDKLRGRPQIASTVAQTCTDWKAYSSAVTVDQIDSGLRVRE